MVRYKKINYSTIAHMIAMVAKIKGHPVPLREMIADMQCNMHIGIDPKQVQAHLGDKVVENVEYRNEVDSFGHIHTVACMKVMVIP